MISNLIDHFPRNVIRSSCSEGPSVLTVTVVIIIIVVIITVSEVAHHGVPRVHHGLEEFLHLSKEAFGGLFVFILHGDRVVVVIVSSLLGRLIVGHLGRGSVAAAAADDVVTGHMVTASYVANAVSSPAAVTLAGVTFADHYTAAMTRPSEAATVGHEGIGGNGICGVSSCVTATPVMSTAPVMPSAAMVPTAVVSPVSSDGIVWRRVDGS